MVLHVTPELDGRQAARVGVSTACKEIADYAATMVSTSDDVHSAPGDFLARAQQIRIMGLELLHRAVTVELMRGTAWETIADGFGLTVEQAKHQFGHCDLTHLADQNGRTGVWTVLAETCVSPVPGSCDPDPGRAAQQLDDWYRAYHDAQPGDPAAITSRHAVTAGL
ncbi:hypothetical protein [Nonomuraea dietziae]|uniref:hypothetical protein n=1 Tax=Nonomuraea dietziae TaxID=65515 RepID=UPI0033C284B6